jgi:hypothetical protein
MRWKIFVGIVVLLLLSTSATGCGGKLDDILRGGGKVDVPNPGPGLGNLEGQALARVIKESPEYVQEGVCFIAQAGGLLDIVSPADLPEDRGNYDARMNEYLGGAQLSDQEWAKAKRQLTKIADSIYDDQGNLGTYSAAYSQYADAVDDTCYALESL